MDDAGYLEAMYMVVPLLGVALLIIIGLFIIWRCQLQKASRPRSSSSSSSSAQSCYLANHRRRSPPRAMVCRDVLHGPGETLCRQDLGGRSAGDSQWGLRPTSQLEITLWPSERSSCGLTQLSSASPPPSYEEVTRCPPESGSSSREEASLLFIDPPPKYEEIVDAFSTLGK